MQFRSLQFYLILIALVSLVAGCSDNKMRGRIAALDTETLERLSTEYPETSEAGKLIAEELARRPQTNPQRTAPPINTDGPPPSIQTAAPNADEAPAQPPRSIRKDDLEARATFERALKAAKQGVAGGQYAVGRAYFFGEIVPKDEKIAIEWISKAAEQGMEVAQLWMDYQQSGKFERTLEAAEQGNAKAQFAIGKLCFFGVIVPKDDKKAAEWYRKAAEQGDADAQHWMGVFRDSGLQDLPKDDKKAVEWYRKAAEQGHPESQENLAYFISAGRGVLQDDTEAFAWAVVAASNGRTGELETMSKEQRYNTVRIQAQARAKEILAEINQRNIE